ncbi:MAG: hypothetical protein R2710_24575 [Acidimicrobiales bacterium]
MRAKACSISGRRRGSLVHRSSLVAKRGSAASSGAPIASANVAKSPSLPAAITTDPSLVANAPKGVMDGCREPIGPGTTPLVVYRAMAFSSSATLGIEHGDVGASADTGGGALMEGSDDRSGSERQRRCRRSTCRLRGVAARFTGDTHDAAHGLHDHVVDGCSFEGHAVTEARHGRKNQ